MEGAEGERGRVTSGWGLVFAGRLRASRWGGRVSSLLGPSSEDTPLVLVRDGQKQPGSGRPALPGKTEWKGQTKVPFGKGCPALAGRHPHAPILQMPGLRLGHSVALAISVQALLPKTQFRGAGEQRRALSTWCRGFDLCQTPAGRGSRSPRPEPSRKSRVLWELQLLLSTPNCAEDRGQG